MIHDDSMTIIFNPITFNAGEVFYFGSLSYIADQEGILHHIAHPFEKRHSPMVPSVGASLSHLTLVRTTPTKRHENFNQLLPRVELHLCQVGRGPLRHLWLDRLKLHLYHGGPLCPHYPLGCGLGSLREKKRVTPAPTWLQEQDQ